MDALFQVTDLQAQTTINVIRHFFAFSPDEIQNNSLGIGKMFDFRVWETCSTSQGKIMQSPPESMP